MKILNIELIEKFLIIYLSDEIKFAVPLSFFPKLCNAEKNEKNNWEIIWDGKGVSWKEINFEISLDDLKQKENEILSLHKYFLWANEMRVNFDNVLHIKEKNEVDKDKRFIKLNLYMSYWYGALYVVVEGWEELELKDDKIDSLLNSQNKYLLGRYRNGVFHYQRKYFDERFIEFIRDGEDCVNWVRDLNQEFGRYFLEWFGIRKP